jgi:PilZ domain
MDAPLLFHHCPLVEVVRVHREGEEDVPAQTIDLSDAFLRIRSGEGLAPGTPVHVGLRFSSFDREATDMDVAGKVLDRFREPEGEWQMGIQLRFESPAQEKSVLSYLSSCEGAF